MKKIIPLLIIAAITTGCAATQPRTGSIAVHKFATDSYTTDNPFQVKREVVDIMADELQKHILYYIKRDTKLIPAQDCTTGADYELVGRFQEVNSKIDSHWRLVTVTVNQLFEIDTDGVQLKRCKTGEVLVDVGPSKDGENATSALKSLADKIVGKISSEPKPEPN